jgi:hypothetical protein
MTGILSHLVVLLGLVQYAEGSLGPVAGIFATIFSVIGFEILSLGLHAKTYSWSRRFDKDNPALKKFYESFKLETGLLLGTGMIVIGSLILISLVIDWIGLRLSHLRHPEWASLAATLVIIGFGTVFSSLFISAMSMKNKIYEQLKKRVASAQPSSIPST